MTGESSSNNEVLTNLNLNGLLGENAVFFIEHDQVRIGCKVDYGFAVKHLVEQFASMRLTGELKIFDGQVVEKRQHRFFRLGGVNFGCFGGMSIRGVSTSDV